MIWKLTPAQKQQVEALIPTCCNWDNGHCLALDMPCPQQLSVSRINCTYFRGAVLPAQKNCTKKSSETTEEVKHESACMV